LDEQQCIWNGEAFRFLYGNYYYGDYFEPWYYFDYPYYGAVNYGPAYYRSAYSNAASNSSSGSNGSAVDNYASTWLRRADGLYISGSYEQAAYSYARAVQLNPFLLEGWINMGNSLYLLGKYEDALSAYDAALRMEPQNANALKGRSQSLAALNGTKESSTSGSFKITQVGSWASATTPVVQPIVVGSHS
jgi:tetratricopeptide (TPR) repeat protein